MINIAVGTNPASKNLYEYQVGKTTKSEVITTGNKTFEINIKDGNRNTLNIYTSLKTLAMTLMTIRAYHTLFGDKSIFCKIQAIGKFERINNPVTI